MPSAALTSAGLAGASLLAASTMGLFRTNQMPVDGKTALLTGATEGMGRSVARQLAEQGASVVVVARNAERLAETVAELNTVAKSEAQRFHAIAADVAQPGYAERVVADAQAWNGGRAPDIVWCMAGMSTPLLWAEAPAAAALGASRRNMDVNYWGSAEMAHAILRAWLAVPLADKEAKEAAPRHLVFTASVLAFFPVAGYAPYTPTKWALRGLADTLAQEVQLYRGTHAPIRVAVVCPGTILSPGFARENATKPAVTRHLEKDDPQMTPDAVAAAALRGLQRGDHLVTVSYLGDLMRWGVLGGTPRNHALLDTLGAWLVSVVMLVVVWWFHRDIRAFAKKGGRSSTL